MSRKAGFLSSSLWGRKRDKRTTPGLDTTATSDISFMLLIFFLITTSMDSVKGLGRQLPPIDPEEQMELMDVDKSKILTLELSSQNVLTVDGKAQAIDNNLRQLLKRFILTKGPSHIIELQIDEQADYDTYFKLQNNIVLSYRELRDAAAKKKYKVPFAQLSEKEKESLTKLFPQRIQESVVTNKIK